MTATGPRAVRSLRADKVRIPFRRSFPTAQGMWVLREAWILRVTDAEGRTGLGEAVLEPADGETASIVLDQLVREAVDQARRHAARAGTLPPPEELELHGAPGRALRAALDAAALDLGELPADATGPDGPGVGVNATLPLVGPRASAEAALQAMEAGFRTFKLKAGSEQDTDGLVDRVRAVRQALGPGPKLRLDVNGAWDLETAVERLEAVRRYDIEYVEQPIAGDDAAALADVRRRGRVPVAADEAVTSPKVARELLEAGAVDVLVVKPARVGGPLVAAMIAELAAERGVPVVLSTLFETGVGIAAALAAAAGLPTTTVSSNLAAAPDHGLATAGLLEHDLLRAELLVEDGRMWRPNENPDDAAPGALGIVLDSRALRHYTVESVGGDD
jgi:o-succinylbenzoate synthase